MKGEREEVLARRLDWALGEAVGGERAPDVTQAVLARHAAGFDVEVEAPAEPRVRWWLVAALVLFGVGAVAAVFQLERGASTPSFAEVPEVEAPEVEAPAQDLVVVTTLEGIAALSVDARAVELRDLDDAAVAALVARCPRLQHLRIFASTAYRYGEDPVTEVSITDAALEHVAKLADLRRLELVGTDRVRGSGLPHLEGLPLLTDLTLSHFDLDDAALQFLPRLPSLRGLDLTLNHGFGRASDRGTASQGVEAVANCPGLRALAEPRELRLAEGNVTATGTSAFAGMPKLTTLDLSDNAELTTAALQHLPASLEVLVLDRCPSLDADAAVFLLARVPRLRSLSVSRADWLFDPALAAILSLPRLEILDISACKRPTKASLPTLRAAKALRVLDASHCLWLDDALADELKAARPDLEVRRRVW